MKVAIFGDIHGDFETFSYKVKPLIDRGIHHVICCGDFGYWPDYKPCDITNIKVDNNTKVYFCDGNHEDHEKLKKFTEITEVYTNVFYVPRGKIVEFGSSRVMFIGGANSVDKHLRTPGRDWFPEENISEKLIYELLDTKVDVIISHTCPKEILDSKDFGKVADRYAMSKVYDPNCDKLSYILDKYKPRSWFFGHWHDTACGILDKKNYHTEWQLLNDVRNKDSYTIKEL